MCGAAALALLLAAPPAGAGDPPLPDVTVTAPEPRFVAPTRRDRIGRIWAPVHINGQGPFRLVLDTGASHSAVTAQVAAALGLVPDDGSRMMLRGATGSRPVPTIPVHSLEVGELLIEPRRLAVIPDALGGAEGALGTEGMAGKRITIEFRHDRIGIERSRNQPAPDGFLTIPVQFLRGRLLVAEARIGNVRARAVIDTGGQSTLGNLALKQALDEQRRRAAASVPDEVVGATLDVQLGDRRATPPIRLGEVLVSTRQMTFVDLAIFRHWRLTEEPALLVGMDALGLLDTLIIDYRRRELQVRLRRG